VVEPLWNPLLLEEPVMPPLLAALASMSESRTCRLYSASAEGSHLYNTCGQHTEWKGGERGAKGRKRRNMRRRACFQC
jgi:hypothetical protein